MTRTGSVNINGSTLHVENELGLTGLGYVRLYDEQNSSLTWSIQRVERLWQIQH